MSRSSAVWWTAGQSVVLLGVCSSVRGEGTETLVHREAALARLGRIAGKLAVLGRPEIFGGQEHGGLLGPPLPEHVVADFERHHGVVLPAGYRAFITRVGHGGPGRYGGAGPFYGLLSLDRWDEALVEDRRDGVLSIAFPVVPGREYGRDWQAEAGLGDDDELFTGAIALAHAGCGDMAVLVVTGPARGRVAYTFWAAKAPTYPPDPDFLTWYERWLDAALRAERSWF